MKEYDIQILVASQQPVYVPPVKNLALIQAGTALAEERLEGMLHDDIGAHISEKNKLYCELTVQYWAWKNLKADYYGFFHYRRYMNFSEEYPVGKNGKLRACRWTPYIERDSISSDLSEFGLDEPHIQEVTAKYDLLTVLSERMNVTVYQQFCQFHDRRSLDLAIAIVKRRYPGYAGACDAYMHSKYIYFCNMYIMKRSIFYAYMEWLFPILEQFESEWDASRMGGNENRVIGYIAERLFGVYYTELKLQNRIRCCELPYVIFYDTWSAKGMSDGKIRSAGQMSSVKTDAGRHKAARPSARSRMRTFYIGRRKIQVDMRKVNAALPAGSLRRRAVRTVMGRFL